MKEILLYETICSTKWWIATPPVQVQCTDCTPGTVYWLYSRGHTALLSDYVVYVYTHYTDARGEVQEKFDCTLCSCTLYCLLCMFVNIFRFSQINPKRVRTHGKRNIARRKWVLIFDRKPDSWLQAAHDLVTPFPSPPPVPKHAAYPPRMT